MDSRQGGTASLQRDGDGSIMLRISMIIQTQTLSVRRNNVKLVHKDRLGLGYKGH